MEAKTDNNLSSKPARRSGIELLKIFAMFAIILFHVEAAMEGLFPVDGWNCGKPSTDMASVLMSALHYCGIFGNTVFFVCSAWFLLESRQRNMKKLVFMIGEVWLISVVILLAVLLLKEEKIGTKLIVRCLAPTTFANNWYMTCYFLFYLIHPYLNMLIRAMDQRMLLRCSTMLLIVYFGFVFVNADLFLGGHVLIVWVTMYFCIAYLKTYLPDGMDDRKLNIRVFAIALACHFGSILCLNSVFLFVPTAKEDQLYRFCVQSNPFILVMAIALFNLARSLSIQNKTLNTVSGLSMLIYILHGNILIKGESLKIIRFFYHIYGYDHVFLTMVSTAICVFLITAACAWLIQRALHSPMRRISDRLYTGLRHIFGSIEDRMIESR